MNQVMDLVKKNLISIICGVIAVLAIGAVFWPITGMFDDLRQRAEARKGVYGSLKGLLDKSRSLPQLDPTSLEIKPLGQFPTETLNARGMEVKARIEQEAKALLDAAIEINQRGHALLEPNSLPGGTSAGRKPAFDFRESYRRYTDYMDPKTRDGSLPVKLMRAGTIPTPQEVQAEQKRVREDILANDLARDNTGREINRQQVDQKIATELPKVPDQLRYTRAAEVQVYIDPGALDVHPRVLLNPQVPPNPVDIFWAQIGLWVQEDIARSIAEVNKGATNVMDAVVKRVVRIEIPDEFARASVQAQPSPDGGTMEAPAVSSDPSAPIQPNYSVSPTGRVSNGLYDVVHFKLALIVDAEKIPQVLQAFSRNKFMGIFQMDVRPVDAAVDQTQGYFYGTRPVVLLELQGEALFMRAWTTPMMPARLKMELGIAPPPNPG